MQLLTDHKWNRFLQSRLIDTANANVSQDVSPYRVSFAHSYIHASTAQSLYSPNHVRQCVYSTSLSTTPLSVPNDIVAFDIRAAFIQNRHIQLCLISRRSRYRAGTRYFRRGLDHQGHVANFNETEQLLFVEDQQSASQRVFDDFSTKMSYIQIRGSVPVFWAEVNTLRYKPDLQVMDLQDTVRASSVLYLVSEDSNGLPG
jgi:hypothetical protein